MTKLILIIILLATSLTATAAVTPFTDNKQDDMQLNIEIMDVCGVIVVDDVAELSFSDDSNNSMKFTVMHNNYHNVSIAFDVSIPGIGVTPRAIAEIDQMVMFKFDNNHGSAGTPTVWTPLADLAGDYTVGNGHRQYERSPEIFFQFDDAVTEDMIKTGNYTVDVEVTVSCD